MLFLSRSKSERESLAESYPYAGVVLTPEMVFQLAQYVEDIQTENCVEKIYPTKGRITFFGTADDRPEMILSFSSQEYVLVDPTFSEEVDFDEADAEEFCVCVTPKGVCFSAKEGHTGCTLRTASYLSRETLKDLINGNPITK